ncbi:aldehyde dehydrogenase family protein [Ancylobacter dichloromethanicus]|uniref:Aldehyde dehydrogenase n=1 Tax=Ancylobacter dichloromethanicus TaxID=518825 RepID=A0A9W6JBE0_9HYPH|nr:aldehyde dehydrogenase family protein [Ancylobacter dichloromethanicus]MBS7553687.1 aldehyde dehydrogenase family protein [Ancylobacter dichloromethanicus]GLK72755.1 aldehyde dehydrogenase [Ancylobacter dichloromethanicus]
MHHAFRLLINGRLVPGTGTAPVINPATGTPFADRPVASRGQLDEAVASAKAAQPGWAANPYAERRRVLEKVADRIEERAEDLARVLTLEQGKPLRDSRAEIGLLVATIRTFCTMELGVEIIEDSATNRVEAHFRPFGVVAAIVPWNFPLGLIGNKLPPALLAGNTMVIKPASSTPLSAVLLGEVIADVVPAGVVNVLCDNGGLGGPLSEHPDIARIAFTGSTETGKRVAAAAIGDLKRVTLELGGNDAAIILDDADVTAIAPAIFATSFANTGQVCYAIKRVYAQEAVYDALCTELARLADAAIVGDGLDEAAQFGPLQNQTQYETVKRYLDIARRDGTIIAGGEIPDRPGYFIRPTVVRDIDDSSPLVTEEQFGPVLPVVKVRDEDEALARANASPYGLGGSVWSSDAARAARVAARLEAGNIWINQHLRLAPHIPLSPAKQSGIGTELTIDGLKDFAQMVVLDIAK